MSFLASSTELDLRWFAPPASEPESIRVADELLIDMLFAANGHTCESLHSHIRTLTVNGVEIRTLDIGGLLKTKTDYRNKDSIDREAPERLRKLLWPGNRYSSDSTMRPGLLACSPIYLKSGTCRQISGFRPARISSTHPAGPEWLSQGLAADWPSRFTGAVVPGRQAGVLRQDAALYRRGDR